jgi:hypothetical protein
MKNLKGIIPFLKNKNRHIFYPVILIFYLLSAVLVLLSVSHSEFFTAKGKGYISTWNQYVRGNPIIFGLHKFDFEYYQSVAETGYIFSNPCQWTNLQAFPAFPLLIKGFKAIGIPTYWGGMIVANLLLILGLIFLFEFLIGFLSIGEAFLVIAIFLSYPSAFFLHAPYAESTFLFFFALTAWLWQRKRYFWGSVFSGILGVVKIPGVAMTISLGLEHLKKYRYIPRRKFFINLLFLSLLGFSELILFLLFIKFRFHENIGVFVKILNCQYSAFVCHDWKAFFIAVYELARSPLNLITSKGLNTYTSTIEMLASIGLLFARRVPCWLKIYSFVYSFIIYYSNCGIHCSAYRYSLLNLAFPIFMSVILSNFFRWNGTKKYLGIASVFVLMFLNLFLRISSTILFAAGIWFYF